MAFLGAQPGAPQNLVRNLGVTWASARARCLGLLEQLKFNKLPFPARPFLLYFQPRRCAVRLPRSPATRAAMTQELLVLIRHFPRA